ncbi:YadA family autotransporter adhesin [Paraburkholderia sp. B3]|uniref:YadA family autotransporter adhesin n=1 Tax=Paraburkholderia sp. B3 TaxID=3134791 RepID=UPI003982CC63
MNKTYQSACTEATRTRVEAPETAEGRQKNSHSGKAIVYTAACMVLCLAATGAFAGTIVNCNPSNEMGSYASDTSHSAGQWSVGGDGDSGSSYDYSGCRNSDGGAGIVLNEVGGSSKPGTAPDGSTGNYAAVTVGQTAYNAAGVVWLYGPSGILLQGATTTTGFATFKAGASMTGTKILDLAPGTISATSTDAVNGSQLYATNEAISNLSNSIAGGTAAGAVKYGTHSDGSVNYSNVTLAGSGGTVIQNVAAGVNGTDAVNVNQLNSAIESVANNVSGQTSPFFAADGDKNTEAAVASGTHATAVGANAQATGSGSAAVGSGASASAQNAVALGANSVADRDNTVSVGSSGSERQITNVAAGTEGTDAVNLNQLSGAISQANQYTDQQINALGNQVNGVARAAYSGVAAATALTMIPDVDAGKTVAVGVGTGSYRGYQATAIGASARITQNLKVKLGAGFSSAGTTVGGGASYQW